jgi:hypothetical protein
MDTLVAIALLCALAAPLSLLARWFVDRGHNGLGVLVSRGGSDAWWQTTMPWPHGVQEEDGVRWHVPGQEVETDPDAFEIPPVRPHGRVGIHQHGSPR